MPIRTRILHMCFWVLSFQIVGVSLGWMTRPGEHNAWYPALQKSSLTPPPFVFRVTWSCLYILLAIVAHSLWRHQQRSKGQITFRLFALQLLMNWMWVPLFFHFRYLGISLIWILAIAGLVMLLITKYRLYVLSPYFLWLLFAAYLNGYIWIYN